MKREALYNTTRDIVADAYFKDELAHNSCAGCAVGNVIAYNMGYKLVSAIGIDAETNKERKEYFWQNSNSERVNPAWSTAIFTIDGKQHCNKGWLSLIDSVKRQIESTGYSFEELAKIEFAFESADKGESEDEYMFNGLMKVMDALDEIHENTDEEVKSYSKSLFTKNRQHAHSERV